MAIGTCKKCGAKVVWDPSEISAHQARCVARPTPDAEVNP